MLISEHFESQRKAYLELLKEKQPEAISIIQEIVQKHIDEGLFVNDSGVEIFDYMNDNLSICFYHEGTGDCEKFFSIDYDFDKYTGEPLNPPPKFSAYDLDDYSSKKYECASEKHRVWSVNQYYAWALDCWQKSNVKTKVPFGFFVDYYQSYHFDLLKMEHSEYEEFSNKPINQQLFLEELLIRISASKFNHIFLKRGEELLEIGVLFQPKLNFAFERQYKEGQWHSIKKIEGGREGDNDIRNLAGRLLRNAIEEGFGVVELANEIQYQPISDFILPSNLFGSKNHWGANNNISIEDFEAQLNIQLPKDYRNFLEVYNGFQTHAYYGFGYTKYDSIRPIIFYGLTEKSDYDIVAHIEKMRCQGLPDFIPVGEDLEKNQIWLGVSEAKKGLIVYKRFEAPQKKIINYEVDTSFQSFMSEFHYDGHSGIKHIVEANDLEYFKKYLAEKWSWDDGLEWSRNTLDIIISNEEPRPEFLDFAFSKGKRLNRLLRYGYAMRPEIIAVFDKYEIVIPKICYSRRLQSILQSGKPVDENEFNELIRRGGDVNVYEIYETLQKWIEKSDTPNRRAMIKLIKPYHKELSISERIALAIDQRGISFSKKENAESNFELSNIGSFPNIKFPEGVIEFLKNYQGTTPSLSFFEFTIRAGNDRHYVEIDHILTSSEIETLFPKFNAILNKQDIQNQLLPIASTKGGGFLLVNCQKESKQFGSINFIYNHIIRWDQHKPHNDYKFKKSLAVDLKEFILSLIPQDYVFDEMSLQAKNGNIDYFKMRLQKGWNINVFTLTEQTCLHQAVRNNHYELTKFLLENGANANLKVASPDWDSTLAVAMKYADEKMYQLIYENSDVVYTNDFEKLKSYLAQHYGKGYLGTS